MNFCFDCLRCSCCTCRNGNLPTMISSVKKNSKILYESITSFSVKKFIPGDLWRKWKSWMHPGWMAASIPQRMNKSWPGAVYFFTKTNVRWSLDARHGRRSRSSCGRNGWSWGPAASATSSTDGQNGFLVVVNWDLIFSDLNGWSAIVDDAAITSGGQTLRHNIF